MTQVLVLLLALLIGVVAGLRALTAPAVVAWGAFLGWIDLDGTWAEWVAHPITVDGADHLAAGRTGHRPAAQDAEPQGAAAVRRPADHGRVRRRGHRQRVRTHTFSRDWARASSARCSARSAAAEARRRLVAANGGNDLPVALARGRRRGRRRLRDRRPRQLASSDTPFSDRAIRRDHRRRRPGRAAAGGPADRSRADRRGDRAQAGRRHLRQHRLHPDQDAGGQRARRPHWPAAAPNTASAPATSASTWRRSRRARTRSCSTTATGVEVWLEGMEGCTLHPRPRPLRGSAHACGSTTEVLRGRQDLPQRRRARGGARHARDWPTSTT